MAQLRSLTVTIFLALLALPATAQVPVSWAQHHDHEATTELLEQWAEAYPHLVRVEEIGRSVQGRALWLLTLTDQRAGPADRKPALWVDGHSDGGEVLSREVALYLIGYLLENADDERIASLLATRTLYVEPNANPDPGEQVTHAPVAGVYQGVSRTGYLFPVDGDGDGALDEDPPEDVDGDGLTLSMRVVDPDGD